ncbi:hypothetical protein Aab01nite_13290 [Paractinoplanes abujensis]|uniref:Diacylglycerol kinase family enzyme n=1 Tax=Paractinoplanes abujensis TaxID=882441 RepID=A0A7W7FYB6_9ACTN|nr:diacylglycerol kinase family protein [Actinoplanes abujensis]MBB4690848.1 diacylglycerol kinase family enzyme [Actinoplanes abujensis]GID17739.1 hypothetical protein Aab01nite_13290 [Actinoplanes abujensis]
MTSFEIAVLANPTAGRGRHRDLLSQVLHRLGPGARLLEAHSGEEAEAACRAAVASGVTALVAVGGDGTIHRALQAVADRPVLFGVVPAGTGNDFAAGVGVPADPLAAADVIAAALREGRYVPCDLARVEFAASRTGIPGSSVTSAPGPSPAGVPGPSSAGAPSAFSSSELSSPSDLRGHGSSTHDSHSAALTTDASPPYADKSGGTEKGEVGRGGAESAEAGRADVGSGAAGRAVGGRVEMGGGERDVRWFGAVLAGGFDALVNERANLMRWPRGPRRYDLAILLELARLKPRAYGMELDGVDHSFAGMLVAVGNCASYGGGMRILPDADPTDGLLDVVVAAPFGRAALARLKPRLRRGTHVSDPRVTVFRARHVRLRSDGIVAYADGERLGPLDLDLTCAPGAVRLLR